MTTQVVVALYSIGILAAALVGAAIPALVPPTHGRTQLFLSFSAGAMLGAAFFHMLPEAVHEGGLSVFGYSLLGFLTLFLLERYVLVHFCKEDDEGCEVHGLHPHPHGVDLAHNHGPHGTVGLAAFLGLSLHTVTDGIALGSAIDAKVSASVFLAIVFHKLPSSLALSAILLHERYRVRTAVAMSAGFSLAVPIGAALYFLLAGLLEGRGFAAPALAFSAGSFLHLAVSDLIPDLHRRKAQRFGLSLALLAGIGTMWLLSVLGPAHAH